MGPICSLLSGLQYAANHAHPGVSNCSQTKARGSILTCSFALLFKLLDSILQALCAPLNQSEVDDDHIQNANMHSLWLLKDKETFVKQP